MKPPRKPSSGSEVVGSKPLWQIWAETQKEKTDRCDELLKLGCFTVDDLAAYNGWTKYKARNFLNRSGLESEVAQDHRCYKSQKVRFYFPPK